MSMTRLHTLGNFHRFVLLKLEKVSVVLKPISTLLSSWENNFLGEFDFRPLIAKLCILCFMSNMIQISNNMPMILCTVP